MKLTENFSLSEFTSSETAKKDPIKFKEQFTPPKNIIDNLAFGATYIAEPIRAKFGSFSPTVAYRCMVLNTAIGGSGTSMHVTGEAFDETFIYGGENKSAEVFFWLLANKDKIPFTELIWEKGNEEQPNWLHIGWRKQKEQEVLVFNGKKYQNYFQSEYYKIHKQKGFVK